MHHQPANNFPVSPNSTSTTPSSGWRQTSFEFDSGCYRHHNTPSTLLNEGFGYMDDHSGGPSVIVCAAPPNTHGHQQSTDTPFPCLESSSETAPAPTTFALTPPAASGTPVLSVVPSLSTASAPSPAPSFTAPCTTPMSSAPENNRRLPIPSHSSAATPISHLSISASSFNTYQGSNPTHIANYTACLFDSSVDAFYQPRGTGPSQVTVPVQALDTTLPPTNLLLTQMAPTIITPMMLIGGIYIFQIFGVLSPTFPSPVQCLTTPLLHSAPHCNTSYRLERGVQRGQWMSAPVMGKPRMQILLTISPASTNPSGPLAATHIRFLAHFSILPACTMIKHPLLLVAWNPNLAGHLHQAMEPILLITTLKLETVLILVSNSMALAGCTLQLTRFFPSTPIKRFSNAGRPAIVIPHFNYPVPADRTLLLSVEGYQHCIMICMNPNIERHLQCIAPHSVYEYLDIRFQKIAEEASNPAHGGGCQGNA
ncbi:hypothetical protein BKA70DRAFT_1424450 [Coprinopsis sp. MPI-PUGE-AT-0042]|nr:hypothetical protein BKA70DRAFT_1424450 [Coprinopsis sp. MPI-PUGE-AT-0042]